MFRKVLVANRGEIAIRVIRACREMGIATVALFSDVDEQSLHVRLADEAYRLGGAPVHESYLNIERILRIAVDAGVNAIHPGYGLVSENPEFAEACERSGVTYIGPPARVLRALGDKAFTRQVMSEAGIPVVPGTSGRVSDPTEIARFAEQSGYPILLKAAQGGGGKGLRVVHSTEELAAALRAASSEAQKSFSDAGLYAEKLVAPARHLEVQILGDACGNLVHLGERECSIQRRHQKLLEETPSLALDESTRQQLLETALQAARAVGYVNAGTVEFLLDEEQRFYFLEVNSRIQVEHPITELVYGLDLVKEQLRIAAGQPLRYTQSALVPKGAAVECRICAEDPFNDFLPSTGTVRLLREPGGPGVRVESSLYTGMPVSLYYDPLLAKLATWGETRQEAIQRMQRALHEFHVVGVKTTVPFHHFALRHQAFLDGDYRTNFVQKEWSSQEPSLATMAGLAAVVGAALVHRKRQTSRVPLHSSRNGSAWKTYGRWCMTGRRGL
ncbi:MAG: acetyl-CoA carboxylase biotin carboxylase subunit [Chloroflexota bacterium]|nr:MAG: acetyl-CoA carboxylase biotin carboxylase subunit [Chloroflexota bacterium]